MEEILVHAPTNTKRHKSFPVYIISDEETLALTNRVMHPSYSSRGLLIFQVGTNNITI